jgi:hypothetical protein
VIRSHSIDEDKPYNVYNRLFIGCERWQSREGCYTYVRLNNLDPVAVLQTWGRDRCRVHADILEELNINWNNADEGKYQYLKYSNVLVVLSNICQAVYANLQGPKGKRCPFYHSASIKSESESEPKTVKRRGNIIQLECQVKFHFFLPVFTNNKPSTNSMVIVSYGEHTNPPPPPRKVPSAVQERLLKAVMGFSLTNATA